MDERMVNKSSVNNRGINFIVNYWYDFIELGKQ